jgi:hypothetical protein
MDARVERANGVLQDRCGKELRLCDISTMDEANAYAVEFMNDYNRRFAKAPQSDHDAHRLLCDDDCLDDIFTWQEERTLSKDSVARRGKGEVNRRSRQHALWDSVGTS